MQYVPGSRVLTTDVCVPISNFPRLIREIKTDFEERGITAPLVGHSEFSPSHLTLNNQYYRW